MSQSSDILAALQRGETLTRLDCFTRFQCFKGPARIAELRQAGHAIETEMIEENGKRFARWSLAGQLALV